MLLLIHEHCSASRTYSSYSVRNSLRLSEVLISCPLNEGASPWLLLPFPGEILSSHFLDCFGEIITSECE